MSRRVGTESRAVPVRADDRVADVLARDEELVDVFESVSPAFGRLRNPGMRRVMARLVTVAQAARVAGVDVAYLLDRLNATLEPGADTLEPGAERVGGMGDTLEESMGGTAESMAGAVGESGERPAELAAIEGDRVVELDVRPDLREGKEPFSRIMAARREVPEGGALKLRAIFEPAPLYAVMAKQGLAHWTECRGEEDWVVWFYPAGGSAGVGGGPGPVAAERSGDESEDGYGDGVVVLDVRGLEPPEPMVRTLAALESLPPGGTLVQINVREPRFLLPRLEERGFEYEVREHGEDLVRVFIRHAGE